MISHCKYSLLQRQNQGIAVVDRSPLRQLGNFGIKIMHEVPNGKYNLRGHSFPHFLYENHI